MLDKKIEALKLAAQTKKQDALQKTETAIETLIQNNHKITVRSVAREAGVSPSYIYKYPELAYKIQTLREQQKYHHPKPQAPSGKTHQIIATHLRNRIKIVEAQKAELNNEIKTLSANISQMSKSKNPLECLKAQNIELIAENKHLTQQLEQYEREICQLRDFILKQRYINQRDRLNELESNKAIQLLPPEDKPYLAVTEADTLDDEVQQLLSNLEIKLSKTLIKLIKSKPKAQVINAINIVQENIESGVAVRSKVKLFKNALN